MRVHRHGRFFLAAAAGLATFVLTWRLPLELRVLVAADGFFVAYLGLMAAFALDLTPDRLRERAASADEGMPVILLLTAFAIAVSLGAIFALLNHPPTDHRSLALVAIASVPLGWATTHTVAAFHYAHLFYAPGGGAGRDSAGIDFPGTPEPGMSDFLYFAFVIGMTAQVADTDLTTATMRRAVLVHAVAAFFYNTVLIALAVNAAINLAG